jgi:hypothetical protein
MLSGLPSHSVHIRTHGVVNKPTTYPDYFQNWSRSQMLGTLATTPHAFLTHLSRNFTFMHRSQIRINFIIINRMKDPITRIHSGCISGTAVVLYSSDFRSFVAVCTNIFETLLSSAHQFHPLSLQWALDTLICLSWFIIFATTWKVFPFRIATS